MKVICSGMERSGSTVAWQITQLLLEAPCAKTHLYTSDFSHGLYTYRHPAESYISFRDRLERIYPVSIAKDYARERIEKQADVFGLFEADLETPERSILFLRYEDYYYDLEKRVTDVANWLKIDIDHFSLNEILEKTSIKQNMKKGDFSEFDKNSGLHGSHINPATKGRPGALLELLDNDSYLRSSSLKILCKKFGYDF